MPLCMRPGPLFACLAILRIMAASAAQDHTAGAGGFATAGNQRQAFAIVQPLKDSSKLQLIEEGLNAIATIEGLVMPVVVIGPYRSGKSFTLNQLMSVNCDEGFGVGHSRLTQTKGIWVWGQPTTVPFTGSSKGEVQMLYFDTEGFESTGKADAYDDRIFALSALISQVLIYNLPETIRESDLEKLSFAVQLADAFYTAGPDSHAGTEDGNEQEEPVRPGSMVWLIQRDFLQGKALEQTLQDALEPVANPNNDPGLEQLNRIRLGLRHLARNSTALGLPQPHLDRTRLCELGDASFAPAYLAKREELRALIKALAAPKVVQGQPLTGKGLAELIRQVVTALNDREIPSAGSLVEYFNRELVAACTSLYVNRLEEQKLPINESVLTSISSKAEAAAFAKFDSEKFGSQVGQLRESLGVAIARELAARTTANAHASSQACGRAELACEEVLDQEGRQHLPSMGRFQAKYEQCLQHFRKTCIGPAHFQNLERLQKSWIREHSRFSQAYNERLLNGLVMISLVAIIVFRFVVRLQLGETAGWITFVFLQVSGSLLAEHMFEHIMRHCWPSCYVYPKTFLASEATMFDTTWWKRLVHAWEALVFNPVLDMQSIGLPLIVFALVLLLTRRWWQPAVRAWFWKRQLRRRVVKAVMDERDLNV